MCSSTCWLLTCMYISQEAGQLVWYSHLEEFSTVSCDPHKVFGTVNKVELDFFSWILLLFDDPTDVGILITGSSAFSKSSLNIWNVMIHIVLKPGLENFEYYFTCVWDKCNICVSQCVCVSHSVCWNISLCVCLSLYVCVSLRVCFSLFVCGCLSLSVFSQRNTESVFLCASVYVSLMWLYMSHSQGLCLLVSQSVCLSEYAFLCVSLCVHWCLCLCVCLIVWECLSLSVCVSHCVFFFQHVCLSPSLYGYLRVCVSLTLCVCVSQCVYVFLSLCVCVSQSGCVSVLC